MRLDPLHRPTKYQPFIKKLDREAKKHPNDPEAWWLQFPNQQSPTNPNGITHASCSRYKQRIDSGTMLGIGFEARQHNRILWVRRDPDFINP